MERIQVTNPVDRAVAAFGKTDIELADALGITHQAVSRWRQLGYVSYRYAAKVSALTGIPEYILCPNFFRPPKKSRRGKRVS
jgi:transcriptional regulator with XRE-family HTH domain|nr:MAG TPA: CI repressor [Caudoviricetes sp.]